jgi:hypothetical protein
MDFKWQILDLSAENDLITHAKYHLSLSDGKNTVETEGHWYFKDPVMSTPLAEVTEEMVAQWIENDSMKDGANVIKSRLEEQLALLEKSNSIVPPWKPQVFTPNLG